MKTLLLTLICVVGMITIGKTQCTNATYGQWPTTTYTPALDDSWELISSACYNGEYSVVSVVSGQHYQFLSFSRSLLAAFTNFSFKPLPDNDASISTIA